MGHDDGGSTGPTYEGPTTAVDPGNLESFAKFIDELADGWNDPNGYAITMDRQAPGDRWVKLGTFPAAAQLDQAYQTAHGGMQAAAANLYTLLTGLAEATRKVAENYRNSEQLAGASVQEVESLLAQHATVQPPGQPPGTGQNPPTGNQNPQ